MIRGTGYAAAEIVVWMVAAGIIGLLIGWLLGRWSGRRRQKREWQAPVDAERKRADSLDEELAAVRASSKELEDDLKELRSKVEELEAEAEVLSESVEEGPTASSEDATPGTYGSIIGAAAQETTSLADIAIRTRAGHEEADDELSKIPGVGPELEERLKALGITSFRQVANLTSDDVVVVTEALGTYSGRIAHDNWMASAAVEHERKYGEPL